MLVLLSKDYSPPDTSSTANFANNGGATDSTGFVVQAVMAATHATKRHKDRPEKRWFSTPCCLMWRTGSLRVRRAADDK
jgi:hypothetical protein